MLLIERISNDILQFRFKNLSRLTSQYALALKDEIKKHCQFPCQLIDVDLSGIHFIDAKSFDALCQISEQTQAKNIYFRLSNVSEEAWELIDLMQLTQSFNILRSVGSNQEYHPSLS